MDDQLNKQFGDHLINWIHEEYCLFFVEIAPVFDDSLCKAWCRKRNAKRVSRRLKKRLQQLEWEYMW